ncbi:NAD(P)/FAD-dependent oxidoreductase [Luteibacter yeojuensis]
MAHVVVLGAGLGGIAAAYDLRAALGKDHRITVVGDGPYFNFTPSNPWIAVGWRKPEQIRVALDDPLAKHDIAFKPIPAQSVQASDRRLVLVDGQVIDYDYLVITSGPRLAFDEVTGLGPDGGFTQSICTGPHAEHAWEAYQAFLSHPGPMVVGAVQGASCYGPAYEFAMIVDADLRRRKLRHLVPLTFVTAEPYIGHMGLGGVGDSKGMLEAALRKRDIRWITNAKVTSIDAGTIRVDQLDDTGHVHRSHELPHTYAMFIPAFTGVPALRGAEGLTNPRGFVVIDKHQRNPTFPQIFAAGVCVAIPPVEATPVPTGAPKTGFMIESMVGAIVENIKSAIDGRPVEAEATWNAVCLADMGDTGAAFVALPQMPPRNVVWIKEGKWVRLAKAAFEKYFLNKVRTGNTHPVIETYVLRLLGIRPLKGERTAK